MKKIRQRFKFDFSSDDEPANILNDLNAKPGSNCVGIERKYKTFDEFFDKFVVWNVDTTWIERLIANKIPVIEEDGSINYGEATTDLPKPVVMFHQLVYSCWNRLDYIR